MIIGRVVFLFGTQKEVHNQPGHFPPILGKFLGSERMDFAESAGCRCSKDGSVRYLESTLFPFFIKAQKDGVSKRVCAFRTVGSVRECAVGF